VIVRTFAAWRGDCLKDWTLTALDRARNARAMRPSSYIEIDGETLTQLYVQDCLPMTEIAKRLGCSSITVARRLRLHDIASRPRGPVPLGRTVSGENSGWSPDLAWAIGLIATTAIFHQTADISSSDRRATTCSRHSADASD